MAAVTSIIAGGLALAGGVTKAVKSNQDKKKYDRLIEDYQRQNIGKESNPYANLRVSTEGAMIQQETSAQNTATALYNLRKGGANTILGGTGKVLAKDNMVNQRIAANLDQQQNRNEFMEARGEADLMRMRERREESDLAGLGNASNVSNHNMWGGISEGITGLGVGLGALDIGGNRADKIVANNKFTKGLDATQWGAPTNVNLSTPDYGNLDLMPRRRN